MKRYVVFGYKYRSCKQNILTKFYVEANNKMDAVRLFKEKYYGYDDFKLDYVRTDKYDVEQCVIEYIEPIFESRDTIGWED